MNAWPKFQVVYTILMEWGGGGGLRRTRRLPRTLYPTDFTNLLTSRAISSKNFWFLNFIFPSPIIEFTWYIRFWCFCGFPYIAMCGLLLFSQRTLQLKQGNSLIKKITKNIRDRKTMQNASTSNVTKFQEKWITPSRDMRVWSFNAVLHENSFCVGWHLLLRWVTYAEWHIVSHKLHKCVRSCLPSIRW